MRKVRQINSINQMVSEVFAGSYHSAFRDRNPRGSQGIPTWDEVRSIDWNVTAKLVFLVNNTGKRELTIFGS